MKLVAQRKRFALAVLATVGVAGVLLGAGIMYGLLSPGASRGAATADKADNPWYRQGQASLRSARALRASRGRARNVILFVGDGMGMSTVTAARILQGQLAGKPGEEGALAFERFPHLALSKTYNSNQQTPDSAGTMSAMVTGIKTRAGVLSVDETVVRGEHVGVLPAATLLEEAEARGLSTGIVTTARVTHATPAACYAHSPERGWEDDSMLSPAARADGYPDIARQLVEFAHGDGPEVVLGGGRQHFLPVDRVDPEGGGGRRRDGRDLIAEWRARYPKGAVVYDRAGFEALDPQRSGRVLGLLAASHMQFELDRSARTPGADKRGADKLGEPSLAEMTDKAIRTLRRGEAGYLLYVEAGRIDHAHHGNNAARALHDTIALSDAVARARAMTDAADTLIIVTADHGHVMTIAGYATRGHDILGKVVDNDAQGRPRSAPSRDADGKPYTTLSYANGPGHVPGARPQLGGVDTAAADYRQEALAPLASETHSGEDVAIYASGPAAHLFHGTREQHYIYHVMRYALRFDGEAGP